MENHEKLRLDKIKKMLSYPYENGIGDPFNDKMVNTVEDIKIHLQGLTYREAALVLDVLKNQIEFMSIVSNPLLDHKNHQ